MHVQSIALDKREILMDQNCSNLFSLCENCIGVLSPAMCFSELSPKLQQVPGHSSILTLSTQSFGLLAQLKERVRGDVHGLWLHLQVVANVYRNPRIASAACYNGV
jgi:hypothetical protein